MSICEKSYDNTNKEVTVQKHTYKADLLRRMQKPDTRPYHQKTFHYEAIAKSIMVLMDNGIEKDDAYEVLQAIGFTLLNRDIYNNTNNAMLDMWVEALVTEKEGNKK